MTVSTRFPTANEVASPFPQWTNPTNAQADDAVDATATAIDLDVANNWKTFGFDADIPAGATINSVKVILEYGIVDGGGTLGPALYTTPIVGGVNQTERFAAGSGAYPTVVTVDHTADRAWTRADLLDASFKVRVTAQGDTPTNDYQLDYVTVEVTYTAAGASTDLPRRFPQPGAPLRTTAEQPRTRTNAFIAEIARVTRLGPIPVDPQPLPVYPRPANQPRHTEASWMKGVIDATRLGPIPVDPQPLPVYPKAADQPRHVEASWMKGVIDATRPVLPSFENPPLPVPLMVAPQLLFDATAPANAQPVPLSFVPLVDVPPLPPRPWAAPQPAPDLAWIAQITADRSFPPWPQPSLAARPPAAQPIFLASWIAQILSDFPLPIGPQPLPPRPWTAGQPIASAAWLAGIVSDFQFTRWPQAAVGAGRTSPDRVSPLTWAQLFEGGGFPLLRWPQLAAVSPATAGQPLVDVALVVDQGQLAPSPIALRAWPQPLPLAPFTSPDRVELLAAIVQVLDGGMVLAQRVPRNPTAAWTASQPLADGGLIADQGQPAPLAIALRAWPRSLPSLPFTSPDRAGLIASIAQVLEGGVVLAQRLPLIVPARPPASQPTFEAAFIADKGQPLPALFVPRSWPQPFPEKPKVGQQARVLIAPLSTGGHACFVLTDTAMAGFLMSDVASVGMVMSDSVAAAFLMTLLTLANYELTDVPSAGLKNDEEDC